MTGFRLSLEYSVIFLYGFLNVLLSDNIKSSVTGPEGVTRAHYGNMLISLSWSKQPKDTTTPTSNCPPRLSGGHLWTGRWFCTANLFTGTSPGNVTTSRDSTIPSPELLQSEHGSSLSCTHFTYLSKNKISQILELASIIRCFLHFQLSISLNK